MSQASLDEIKARNSHKPNESIHNSKQSIILAGSSTKDSVTSNVSDLFVTSMEPAPDLNKRIDLFQIENLEKQYQCNADFMYSSKKIDDYKENINPQCAVIDQQLENEVSKTIVTESDSASSQEEMLHLHKKSDYNVKGKGSNRDTNHNIHQSNSDATCLTEKNAPIPVTEKQLFSLSSDTRKGELQKVESMLCFLDNQLNQIKEVAEPQQIFRRLSDKYIHSPKTFTERLLTIIEESVINNDDNIYGSSAINLSRLTTEFRRMCKFIEDETPPEWPPSPMSTPPHPEQVLTTSICNKSVYANVHKSQKPLTSSINTTPLSATPLSGTDVLKRRFFQKISKNNYNRSTDNVINLSSNVSSTESFERLEAQCKRLFPEEKEYIPLLRKSSSMPSLLNMSQIKNICEQQMALLNVSDTVNENYREKAVVSSPNLLDKSLYESPLMNKSELNSAKLLPETSSCRKNVPHERVSYSKIKSMEVNKQSDSDSKKIVYDYLAFDPDELEKTLLQDIAEKRKRCLDTARLITEINANPEVTEGRKSLTTLSISTSDSDSNSLSHDEAHFLKTLTSCQDYQSYLKRQKPLFNLLYKPSSFSSTPKPTFRENGNSDFKCEEVKDSKKQDSSAKKSQNVKNNISTPNIKPCDRYKSPLSGNKSAKNKANRENIKPKLFVTPGKSPQNANCKEKKIYFPSMYSLGKNKTGNILKSPHAEGLYRLNYNTIISPVGMYIRGTDMQLIKNVRAKTDNLLLSPAKKNVKTTPSRNSKQTIPFKSITKTQKTTPLRINLSPKVKTNEASKQKVNANIYQFTLRIPYEIL